MGQVTARHIRQTVSSALLLILGAEAGTSAGMGPSGTEIENEYLIVTLVSVSHA